MKTIIVRGGLGNQVFEYAFGLYLQNICKTDIKYLRRTRGRLSGVEDIELSKVFDIDIKTQNWRGENMYKFYKLLNAKKISNDKNLSFENDFFDGLWQDKKYYKDLKNNWIRFKEFNLSTQNTNILNKIRSTNSVAIHVRRGNYLSPRNIGAYGGICTEEYYNGAIKIIEGKVSKPNYYIFSNDIEWVEQNLKINNSSIISWNQGDDSYLDLYLMSNCKSNIIANSTFSYWAAYLNAPKKIVVYPKLWYNPESEMKIPDIFMDDWMGI